MTYENALWNKASAARLLGNWYRLRFGFRLISMLRGKTRVLKVGGCGAMRRTREVRSESKGSPPMWELVSKGLGSLRSPPRLSYFFLAIVILPVSVPFANLSNSDFAV